MDALLAGQPIPEAVQEALDELCEAVRAQGCRLWVDAEQQVLQPHIDNWTIDLMRKYNTYGKVLIYNTIQSYLKGSKANLDRHITSAAREGWALGVKLVRGAYIEHETRSLIHDSKEETDRNYDLCADTLISQRLPKEAELLSLNFPKSALFLATHNAPSALKAVNTHRNRVLMGLLTTNLECGQIVGLADELSYKLVQNYEECMEDPSANKSLAPRVLKCASWGTVGECMGYLHRRIIENRGAVERTKDMSDALKKELKRRVAG